MEDIFNSIKR